MPARPLPWSRTARTANNAILLLFLVSLLQSCGSDAHESMVFSGNTMGTYYRVTVVTRQSTAETKDIEPGVIEAMEAVNRDMSTYRQDSALSEFNRSPSLDWFEVPSSLVEVVALALQVSRASDGAFDVTVGPLVNLWGFGPQGRPEHMPSQEEIQAARSRTGFLHLSVRKSPPALRKSRPDLYVDLSAIAKGYAVDRVCEFLESRGTTNYLVDIGGDVRARGHNPDGEPWVIAIESPDLEGRRVHDVVGLTRHALATSGDYRNYFEEAGRRYSHTIDPRTGRPIEHRLASASVVADDAATADAFATAAMVLGPDEALGLLDREGLQGLLIVRTDDGFSTRDTPQFNELRKSED